MRIYIFFFYDLHEGEWEERFLEAKMQNDYILSLREIFSFWESKRQKDYIRYKTKRFGENVTIKTEIIYIYSREFSNVHCQIDI